MNTSAPFITEIAGGIATVTLQRPEIHNAFDDDLINRLTREFQGLGRDTVVRAVVLAAKGKSFSAGANVNWMKRMAEYGQEENLEDAKALAGLMFTLASLRKPTIAAVQGSAFGGGVGLVAACDIAIAAREAEFALTEVKLGILPAAVGPYVVSAMGPRQATRYMLTGERFNAERAAEIGEPGQADGFFGKAPEARQDRQLGFQRLQFGVRNGEGLALRLIVVGVEVVGHGPAYTDRGGERKAGGGRRGHKSSAPQTDEKRRRAHKSSAPPGGDGALPRIFLRGGAGRGRAGPRWPP